MGWGGGGYRLAHGLAMQLCFNSVQFWVCMPVPFVSPFQTDYGCIVYELANPLVLMQLDLIHYQGLCIALGDFCTSPAQSLYVEACQPFLVCYNLKPALNYVLKLKSLPEKSSLWLCF